MNSWFKVKTAGLPRWAWGGIVGGALVLGLYLRSRSNSESEPSAEPPTESGLGAYNETEGGAGLAAAGLIGPASSTMVPVQTPFLPEGIVDILTGLGEIITNQGTVIENISNTHTEYAPGITGGGAPEPGGDHTPPPAPAAPKCSAAEYARITWLAGEIARLSGEAQAIAGAVAAKKAQYPDWQKRENVRQWINQQEGSKAAKQDKRDEYQNEINHLRQKCAA
jgi:hypothetical protein